MPLQLSIGDEGGVEAVSLSIHAALLAGPPTLVLCKDVVNACSSVLRQAGLDAVALGAKGAVACALQFETAMAPYSCVTVSKGTPPPELQAGAWQGEILSMILFALVVDPGVRAHKCAGVYNVAGAV